MSLEAEICNSLKNLGKEIKEVVKTSDDLGGKLRPAVEDVKKSVEKTTAATKESGNAFSSIGHHMAMQLRRVALEGFGVTAVLGFINDKITEHKKRIEEAGNATLNFQQKTRGMMPDAPGLRQAMGRMAGLTPDESTSATQEFFKAGGKRNVRAVSAFAHDVMSPAIMYGFQPEFVSRIGGMANKAGLTAEQTKDVIAYLRTSGISEDKINKLTSHSMRRLATQHPGSWRAMVKETPITDLDRNAEAIRIMTSNEEWDKATDLEALRKKRREIATRNLNKPWYSPRQMGESQKEENMRVLIKSERLKEVEPQILDSFRQVELKTNKQESDKASSHATTTAPLGSYANPFFILDKNNPQPPLRPLNAGD